MKHKPISRWIYAPGDKRDALRNKVHQLLIRCSCGQWSKAIKEGNGDRELAEQAFNFHLAQSNQLH